MKIGILTSCTGKPKKRYGLADVVEEIEDRDDISYEVINPQNIFFDDNFKYLKKKKENKYIRKENGKFRNRNWMNKYEVLDFKEKFLDIDYLYIRGFRSKNSKEDKIIVKEAIKHLDMPVTNNLECIEYCNNKIYPIIDILTCGVNIDGFDLKEIIPKTRIFNLKNSDSENKEEVKEYVRGRLQGAHTGVVLKDYLGRGGNGIMPIDTGSPYRALIDNYEKGDFIVQDIIEDCVDLRVQIVGSGYYENDIKGSYIREPSEGDFRAQHNKKKEHYDLTDLQKKTSLWIHKRSGADISAIDFLLNPNTKKFYFLEINGENPGWKNLKKIYKNNDTISEKGIAPYLVDYMIDKYRLSK